MAKFKWSGKTAEGVEHEGTGESGTDCVNQATALKVENPSYEEIPEEAGEETSSPVPGLSETQVLEIPAEPIAPGDATSWEKRARMLADLIVTMNTVLHAHPNLSAEDATTKIPIWGTLLNLSRATIRND